jgi:hydroxymethylbilane synthase
MKIGTRSDALALAQAQAIASALGAELVVVPSVGHLSTAALRDALLAGEVDAVVHSFPDIPIEPVAGLSIAAVPKRDDARDALCARGALTLADLPAGARVGAGSPLRRAQLLSRRSDLELLELPVDLHSALGWVSSEGADHQLDAVVLAAGALARLTRLDAISEYFGIDSWPTAPAQGALAVETRMGDEKTVAKVEHRPSRLTAEAERAVLALLRVDYGAPIGAHAILDEGLLFLSVRVYRGDGSEQVTSSHALYPEDSSDPIGELAKRVVDELLASGAAEIAKLDTSRDIPDLGGTA